MGKAEEQFEARQKLKEEVTLLICRCESCTTWEIGHRGEKRHHLFLLCKTCGLEVPLPHFEMDDHHMLHWAKHER